MSATLTDLLPATSGTYTLLWRSTGCRAVEIGRLGELQLNPGSYCYIGSAFGPGGLRARIRRHAKRDKRLHWHMDYLRPYLSLGRVWISGDPLHREHLWADWFRHLPGTTVPLPGFGSSDCTCETHLLRLSEAPTLSEFQAWLLNSEPTHAPVTEFLYV